MYIIRASNNLLYSSVESIKTTENMFITEDMNNVDLEGSLSRLSLARVSLSHNVTNSSAGFELVARIIRGFILMVIS